VGWAPTGGSSPGHSPPVACPGAPAGSRERQFILIPTGIMMAKDPVAGLEGLPYLHHRGHHEAHGSRDVLGPPRHLEIQEHAAIPREGKWRVHRSPPLRAGRGQVRSPVRCGRRAGGRHHHHVGSEAVGVERGIGRVLHVVGPRGLQGMGHRGGKRGRPRGRGRDGSRGPRKRGTRGEGFVPSFVNRLPDFGVVALQAQPAPGHGFSSTMLPGTSHKSRAVKGFLPFVLDQFGRYWLSGFARYALQRGVGALVQQGSPHKSAP
jgi:hypothetical protein